MQQFLPASDGLSDTFIRQLRAIGLTVTGGFGWQDLDKDTQRGLARAIRTAEHIIDYAYHGAATEVDGWRYTLATGRAGHNFALRAAFAKYLLGANVPEQLVYPNTAVDADWRPTGFVDNYIMPLAPFSCQFRVHTRRASDTPVPSESSDDCSTLPRTRTKPASHARRSSMHAGG